MQSLIKQVGETKTIAVDFTPVLATGETVSVGNVTADFSQVVDGLSTTASMLVAGSISHDSGVVTFRTTAGESDTVYKITLSTGSTNFNNIHEEDIYLIVSEDVNLLYTVDELKENLGITSTTQDALLFGLVRSSSDFIENSLNRKLTFKTYTESFYPQDLANFLILKEFPVLSISSIVIDGITLDPTTAGYANYTIETGGVVRRLDGGTFPRGPILTTVVYKAGMITIPEDIRMAVKKIAIYEYTRRLKSGLLAETIGDYKIVFERQSILEDPIVSSVISRYTKRVF